MRCGSYTDLWYKDKIQNVVWNSTNLPSGGGRFLSKVHDLTSTEKLAKDYSTRHGFPPVQLGSCWLLPKRECRLLHLCMYVS